MSPPPTPSAVASTRGITTGGPPDRLRPLVGVLPPFGGALLAGAGAALVGWGPHGLLLVVLVPVQLTLAAGWLTLARVPARVGGLLVAIGAGVAGDVVLVAEHRPSLGGLAGAAGLGVVAAVLGQLLRRERSRVTDVLAAQCSAIALVVAVSSPLALAGYPHGSRTAAAGLVGIALALLAGALSRWVLRGWVVAAPVGALLLGTAAAAGVGAAVAGGAGVAAASSTAAATAAATVLVAVVCAGRRVGRPLAVVVPFAVAGPCLYVVARVVLG